MKLQSNLKLEQDFNYQPKKISARLIVLLCILGVAIGVMIYVYLFYTPYLLDNDEDFHYDAELNLDGDGTLDKPHLIRTPECLEELAEKVNEGSYYFHSYFLLVNDIDMSGREWVGIGSQGLYSFSGSFDGGGYTISGLNVGLFGILTSADIKNLNVRAYNITSYGNVGILAGVVFGGRIDNCTVSGSVTGIGDDDTVGGLAGRIGSGAFISNNSSSATVTGSGRVGGLVGQQDEGTTITNCFATGDVVLDLWLDRTVIHTVGGLVGVNFGGLIERSYATGDVSADGTGDFASMVQVNIGGFIGQTSGEVKTSYATGDVRVAGDVECFVGGFVGLASSGVLIENCYAEGNTYTEGLEFIHGAFAGRLNRRDDSPGTIRNSYSAGNSFFFVGRQFGEVENSYSAFEIEYADAVFIGWDFNIVWYMPENGGFPKLRAFLN
jgi:hypothetical protein